jgi:hypothetical protein
MIFVFKNWFCKLKIRFPTIGFHNKSEVKPTFDQNSIGMGDVTAQGMGDLTGGLSIYFSQLRSDPLVLYGGTLL